MSSVLSTDFSREAARRRDVRANRRRERADLRERGRRGGPEPGDLAARTTTAAAAALVHGGHVLDEGRVAEAAAALREALGAGRAVDRRIEGSRRPLMPFVALLSVLPLGFVLYRRNL